MMEVPIFELGVELGSGGAVGLLVGWALKKLVKLAAAIVGGLILFLGVLEAEGFMTIHWGVLQPYFQNSSIGNDMPAILADVVGVLPIGTGIAAGAWIGFKKG